MTLTKKKQKKNLVLSKGICFKRCSRRVTAADAVVFFISGCLPCRDPHLFVRSHQHKLRHSHSDHSYGYNVTESLILPGGCIYELMRSIVNQSYKIYITVPVFGKTAL